MPTIRLTDQFGLDVEAVAGDLSSLTKYFSNLPHLSIADFGLKSIAGLTLENPLVKSVKAGVSFAQPLDIGSNGVTFNLNAGASGEVDIFVPPAGGGSLFDPDPYGENIAVNAAERYVSFTLSASAGPDIQAAPNKLSFAFQAGAEVTLANYRRFVTQPAAPTVIDAVKDTIANFCIPGDVNDLSAMAPDSLIVLEGTGSVTASGSASLLAAANPLAALSLPSPVPSLQVSAGGAVTVGATCRITWDYQLRVRKIDANRITLGFYRKRGSETTVSVDVHGGVSGGTAGTDLFSAAIGAVSPSAKVDAGELAKLGLSQAQIEGIQSAVKSAAQRKLEVALLASLAAGDSSQGAFLYEFDLAALDDAGSAALVSALRGNLSALASDVPARGIKTLRTIFSDLHRTGSTWKLNLLGVYNYASVSELVRQGTVLFEPTTGDLVITDTAIAKRIAAATVNFGADTAKLRHVLAGSFLITAVYHGSQAAVGGPELECSHTFFELNADTSRQEMRDELDAAYALGLLNDVSEQQLLGDLNDFGRTLLYAETAYSSSLAALLFLNGTEPKKQTEYEVAGRAALQLLIREGGPDDYRRLPAIDDNLWAKMCAAGQFNFKPLFPGLTDLQVQVIASDYTAIVWWAEAMSSCGKRLAAMQNRTAIDPNPEAPEFLALRQDLAKHIADVASQTKEEFGRPWGLVAMDTVSGRRAKARVQITGPRVAVALERGPAVIALR